MNAGSSGKLATLHPCVPAALWTSLATGVYPDKHGVLGPVVPHPETRTPCPASVHMRRSPALWDIASAAGLRTHVIAWPGAVQAEPVNGVFLPPSSAENLPDLHVGPNDLPVAALTELLPLAARIDQRYDTRLADVALGLAATCSIHNAATSILDNELWDFAAVHYPGIGYFSSRFAEYHPPRMAHVSETDFEIFQNLLAAVYRFHDMLLGTLIEIAGPEKGIVLVSPAGYATGANRPPKNSTSFTDQRAWATPYGVICVTGGKARPDDILFGARVVDVAPTVLSLLGLEAPMDGRSLFDPEYTPSAAGGLDTTSSRGLASHFLAMAADDESPLSSLEEEQQFDLVTVYMSTGRPALALPLIERLADRAPEEIRYQRTLVQCYLVLGRWSEAETLLNSLLAGHEEHAWAHYLRGVVYMHHADTDHALQEFQTAAGLGQQSAALHAFIGNVYFAKHMWPLAESSFRQAIAIDSEWPDALAGLAAIELRRREYESAIDLALRAIAVRYETPAAHYQLGLALARTANWERAAVAFRATIALAPGMKRAARLLDLVNSRIPPALRARA